MRKKNSWVYFNSLRDMFLNIRYEVKGSCHISITNSHLHCIYCETDINKKKTGFYGERSRPMKPAVYYEIESSSFLFEW